MENQNGQIEPPISVTPFFQRWYGHIAGFLFFLAIAVYKTWPLALNHSSKIASELVDTVLVIWVIGWNFLSFRTGLDAYFHPPIFYPEKYTLFYSETLYFVSMLLWPLHEAGLSLVSCYNIACILALALSGYAAWLIVRDWIGDPVISLLGGVIFSFTSFHIMVLNRPQLLFSGFLLLSFRCAYQYFQSGRVSYLAGFFILALILPGCCVYYTLYSLFFAAVLTVLALWKLPLRSNRSLFIRWSGALVLIVVLYGMYFYPYYTTLIQQQMYEQNKDTEFYSVISPTAANLFWPIWQNTLYSHRIPTLMIQLSDIGQFPGFLSWLLGFGAILPFLYRYRSKNKWRRSVAYALIAPVVLTLGILLYCHFYGRFFFKWGPLRMNAGNVHELHFRWLVLLLITAGPYLNGSSVIQWLRRSSLAVSTLTVCGFFAFLLYGLYPQRWLSLAIPQLAFVRVHGRWGIFILLLLAIAASRGLIRLLGRKALNQKVALVVTALAVTWVVWECHINIPFHDASSLTQTSFLYKWLKNQNDIRVIAEFPATWDKAPQYQIHALYHRKALINGYSGYEPWWYDTFENGARVFPNRKTLDLMQDHQVDAVLVHKDEQNPALAQRILNYVRLVPGWKMLYEDPDSFVFRFTGTENLMDAPVKVFDPVSNYGLCLAKLKVSKGDMSLDIVTDGGGGVVVDSLPAENLSFTASHPLCDTKTFTINLRVYKKGETVLLPLPRKAEATHRMDGQVFSKKTLQLSHAWMELYYNGQRIAERFDKESSFYFDQLIPGKYTLSVMPWPGVTDKKTDYEIEFSPTTSPNAMLFVHVVE